MNYYLLSHEAQLELESFSIGVVEAAIGPKEDRMAAYRGGKLERMDNGIASIDVAGVLINDTSLLSRLLGAIFGQTLYADLQASLRAAAIDPKVKAVLLRMNTPGGSAYGVEQTAALIRQVSATKPVLALVESQAASAGYWLASAATRIHAAGRSANVGSIGVVATIRDARGRDAAGGVRTFEIVSTQSPRKRPDPATEAGMAQLQSFIDGLATQFVETVAAYRNTTVAHVLANYGQGDVLHADLALAVGMIDAIANEDVSLAALTNLSLSARPSATTSAKGGLMEQPTTTTVQPAPAAVDLAASERTARQAERMRIEAILNHPEAAGRADLARHLALNTQQTVEEAAGVLAAAPKQAAAPSVQATSFERAMAVVNNPNVGTGAEANDEDRLVAAVLSAGKPRAK